MSDKPSRRAELSDYMGTGRLRDAVESGLSEEAQDLLIDIVARYCAPRRRRLRAWKRKLQAAQDGGGK